jgi:hypothetical protein
MKKSIVERLVGTLSFNRRQSTKIKCRKPVVKVVSDLLTEKWIFVKRNRHLSAMSPCLENPVPPVKIIQALVRFTSEEEQLVGHELIKATTTKTSYRDILL